MQTMRAAVAVLLSLLLLNVGPVFAHQDHIAPPATLDRLLAEQSARETADRDTVIDTLHHPEVRRLADRMGLPMERAEAAVRALDGEELAALADQARATQASLAGGATTIVISSTVIIIALLIIILILVAD